MLALFQIKSFLASWLKPKNILVQAKAVYRNYL